MLRSVVAFALLLALSGCDNATKPNSEPESINDPINDPVEDPIDDPADDPITDPVDDPADDPVDDPITDPVTDPVDDPVEDPLIDPVAEGAWYRPPADIDWHIQFQGVFSVPSYVSLYVIDLFDTPATQIQQWQAQDKRIICYFNGGAYENWRPDAGDFSPDTLGSTLDGYATERWLDIRSEQVSTVMLARMDLAVEKGCDGIDIDNISGYRHDTGFPLTLQDQLAYNKYLANSAHDRNLSVGLKNALEQIGELAPYYDFTINEQCYEYNECDMLAPFTTEGKPVFNIEYETKYLVSAIDRAQLCRSSLALGLQSLVLPLRLDGSFRYDCETPDY